MANAYISALTAADALTGDELLEVSQLSSSVTITDTTISALASDNSFNDSGSGFISAGFAVSDRVRVSGFTGDTANNILVGTITALTAGKMTIGGTDGDVIVDDAAGESVTISKWVTRRASVDDIAAAGAVTFADAADYRTGTETNEVLSPGAVWDAADYVALSDSGGNIAVDLSTGINFTMTMDGDYTLSAVSNGKPGQTGVIVLTQDGTGTQTLAYNAAWKFAGGADPTLSTAAGAVDLLFYQVLPNGTDVYATLVKAIA